MRRADRLFGIVQHLRTHRFATAGDLAAALGVSKRTIYRDISDLGRSGIPIRGEAGVGYQLEPGFELPPLTFNAAEIEALVLGMRMVESWADGELAAAARSVMSKVASVLPEPLRELIVETPLFAPGRWDAKSRSPELAGLRRAIANHRRVELVYVDAEGAETERVVRPLALYFWGTKWTLAAWCELREAYRNFRPDRAARIRVLETTFAPDGEVSLEGFIVQMQGEAATSGFGPLPTA